VLRLLEAIRSEISGSGTAKAPSAPPFRLPAKRGAKIILLDPGEVLWFEAEDTIVHARTASGRYLVERPLADLEQILGTGFFRSHRSILLNLTHVAEIVPGEGGTYRVVLRDEARSSVPLSRRQAQKLREILSW
jgi:DNA-binding LytR/AlgR family response regulator